MFAALCLLWCDYAWKSPATYKLPKWVKIFFAVVVIAIVLTFAIPNVTEEYHRALFPAGVSYAASWGTLDVSSAVARPPNGGPAYIVGAKASKFVVNGDVLAKVSKRYRMMAFCYHYSGAEDVNDIENLSKSKLFDITSGLIPIAIPWSDAFAEEYRSGEYGTNYVLLLIPVNAPATFRTIREATKLGAVQLQPVNGPP
jgi:hypothetical protein